MTAIAVADGLLTVGGWRVPLLSGEVQFWRMDPATWRPALRGVRDLGLPIISTYLSWRRHEPEPGVADFTGAWDPRLDVTAFLRLAAELDLLVQLKPGPWICAEEPGGGYPDWLLSDTSLLARDHDGEIVAGYNPPFIHPIPSYHSADYLAHVQRWFGRVWTHLADFLYPAGPVCLVQVDNEPSLGFQDALYRADYHPAAVTAFRDWLRRRYDGDVERLRSAWCDPSVAGFATVSPPRPRHEGRHPSAAAEHDWTAFGEWSIAEYLRALRAMHSDLGAGVLLPTVNLNTHPVHDVPQSHHAIQAATGALIGEDHYYEPPIELGDVVRLARSAATARAAGAPIPWVPELQAGIWRSPGEEPAYPDPTPDEQWAWWGAALAVGFRGFNLYMLADRENWEFAPIGADGGPGPGHDRIRQLVRLLHDQPDLLAGRVWARVAVVWHRPDSYDAYAVTGTAREPDVAWRDPARALPYHNFERVLHDLVRHGQPFELWDPQAGELPPGIDAVVVPPACGVSEGHLSAARTHAITVLRPAVPEATVAGLAECGIQPPAVLDHTGTITTVQSGAASLFLHIVHWAEGPMPVRAELRTAGLPNGSFDDLMTGDQWTHRDGRSDIELVSRYHLLRLTPDRHDADNRTA
jgi:hypothetical protein